MSLIRYTRSPGLLDTIQREISDLLSDNSNMDLSTSWKPRVDIQSKNDCYLVHADLPGVDPKNINISVDSNVLTIEGERKNEIKDEQDGISRLERFSGTFCRQFSLPENIASDDITAKCDKGVLKLTIPKRQKQSAKRINVSEE